jgi:hypothetical protein
MIERLPASDRAALAWAPAALEQEVRPLLEGELTADAVATCTAGVMGVLVRLVPALANLLGAERFLSEVDSAYAGALERLRDFLPDPGSRRSADWVVGALQGFIRLVAQVPPEEFSAALDAEHIAEAVSIDALKDDAAGILRGFTLLMAAMSIADRGGDPQRAAELSDLAFLDTSRAVDRLAATGIRIAAPSLNAAPGSPGREILALVEEARAALTVDDIEGLSRARLRDLR